MLRIRVFHLIVILLVVPIVALAELPPVFVMEWGNSVQFGLPMGVGVGSDGSVYVVDYGNYSVEKFTSEGYHSEWGSFGTGDGAFIGPWGIAVTASGYVYVTDMELERVQVFDEEGTFVRKWGGGIGSSPGYFRDVVGVAVNEAIGYVYTVERENRRVQCFTLAGTFIKQWGAGPTRPVSITVAPNGDVFVLDETLAQVQHFDSTGASQGSWTDAGTLVSPAGIAADADGDLYITSGSQVHKYTAGGTLLMSWSPGAGATFLDVRRGPGTVVDDIYVVRSTAYMVSHWQWWPRPEIGISPASLDFGTIAVNTTATDTLFVSNTGDTVLTVQLDVGPVPYTATPSSFTVAIGATEPVQIEFAPTEYGNFDWPMDVYSDDPANPYQTFPLNGDALSPDIVVAPDTLWFPDTIVGTSSVDSVMVRNVGEVTLVVSSVWATWPGSFVPSPESFSLAVGDTQWVHVTFTPTGTTGYGDNYVVLESDDPDEDPYSVAIYADGVASDLAFSQFWSPTGLGDANNPIQVAYRIHNYGTGNTLPYTVGVYASEDSIITTDDELLGTAYSPTVIAPGDSTTRSLLPMPAPTLRGNIYLGLIADCDESVYELSESNNTVWAPFTFNVPAIYNVRDVPDDQGGYVYMSWYASPLDASGGITEYSLWRAINADAAAALLEGGIAKVINTPQWSSDLKDTMLREDASGMYFWELMGTQPAYRLPGYGKAMPTMFDSTGTDPEYHYFQVIAHTANPAEYYISAADSARSVDNLAPDMPLNLVAAQSMDPEGLDLAWDPNTEADLSHYAIYRGDTPDFTPDESNRVGTVSEAAFHDPDWRWDDLKHYKVSAVDVHENESPYATAGPATVTGVDPPSAPLSNYLAQNHPNPFNPVTTIEFGLMSPDVVTIRIYDATGRRVRTLVDGPLPAKHHALQWNGVDDRGSRVASGVYFYRMETGAFTKTRKMVLLK